jgi:hypothetical protein
MAIGLPVMSAVFLVDSNFDKMWLSRRNILVSATPSEIKCDWYVCMYKLALWLIELQKFDSFVQSNVLLILRFLKTFLLLFKEIHLSCLLTYSKVRFLLVVKDYKEKG